MKITGHLAPPSPPSSRNNIHPDMEGGPVMVGQRRAGSRTLLFRQMRLALGPGCGIHTFRWPIEGEAFPPSFSADIRIW